LGRRFATIAGAATASAASDGGSDLAISANGKTKVLAAALEHKTAQAVSSTATALVSVFLIRLINPLASGSGDAFKPVNYRDIRCSREKSSLKIRGWTWFVQ